MDANKILSADILDIVFEGKNKEYGAYNLRKTYNKRIITALLITIGAIALILLINFLANALHTEDNTVVTITDVSLSEVKKIPPPPPPPPKSALPPPPVQAATVKFLPPVIKKDEDVPKDVKPPDQKDLDTKAISTEDKAGPANTAEVTPPPPTHPGSGVAAAPADDNTVFTKVEIEAGFPGGPNAWIKYVQRNVDGSVASENGANPGTYKVLIQFIVSKDGTISDVHALTNFGYGMEEEAIKAIKNGPKWTPAQQNGHVVNAYRLQPVVFQVEEP